MMEKLEQETRAALNDLCAGRTRIPEAEWFLQQLYAHFSLNNSPEQKPELIVLGEDFPWELAWSFGARPYFIMGGSLETTRWSDTLLPRDADPVSRSACGYLLHPHGSLTENALIVTTLCSDNRRKLAELLRCHGLAVVAADVPPLGTSDAAREIWVEEMRTLCEEIEHRTGYRFRRSALRWAMDLRSRIREEIRSFLHAAEQTPGLSAPLRHIITESVWHTENPEEWLWRLEQLTEALRDSNVYFPPDRRPNVLLVGSPVHFPNEKLPLLLDSAGLRLLDCVSPAAFHLKPAAKPGRFDSAERLFRRMAESYAAQDLSGSQTVNRGLAAAVEEQLKTHRVDGILYHVLKGQIEFDFELPRIEELAETHGIPVFRLETDYQPQDVEQLRIRAEAFAELLRQNLMEGAHTAS